MKLYCICIYAHGPYGLLHEINIYIRTLYPQLGTVPFISASLYLLCAGIHRELALACARVKKIFHLNISTFCPRLHYIHNLLLLCVTNIICAGIHRKLALACAWDKEIFHLNVTNVTTLSSTL